MNHTPDALRTFAPLPAETDFSPANLPYGVFAASGEAAGRVGVAIGAGVLDLTELERRGRLAPALAGAERVFAGGTLNAFIALGRATWRRVRARVQALLAADNPELRDDAALRAAVLRPQADVQMRLPVQIGDYTDFYASQQHARNVGEIFRGANAALPPAWLHLPIGYHGRASSVVVSGAPVRRPCGQSRGAGADPHFGPSRELDFELELGCLVGPGNRLGEPIPLSAAADHVFGFVLLNDWSARDIQQWEYQPLGPFLGKNFATTISPWVVPAEALAPALRPSAPQAPTPLPYLREPAPQRHDVQLEVRLRPAGAATDAVISRTNAQELYWSAAQLIAHHTVNGCNLRPGDLLGSGTISGPTPGSCGSLLELAWRGARPLRLAHGATRSFLEDGDTVTLTGWCDTPGGRVGFGECAGTIVRADDPAAAAG